MRSVGVPVSMGSQASRTVETQSFRVTEVWFPPHAVLEPHTHDRAIFATMVAGGFRTEISSRTLSCDAGLAWTEPLGEKHANHVGAEGAQVVVIQPDGGTAELLEPFAALIGEVRLLKHPAIAMNAPLILSEIRKSDAYSALCIDALVVTLLAGAARFSCRDKNRQRPPGWLLRARDMLHAEWQQKLTLSDLARCADVHPAYLARGFRDHFGESVGSYVRKLRLNWAIAQLVTSDASISHIALRAGFSDQSHLTRECRKRTGFTPAACRARAGGRLSNWS
jgi:AraC family transcriptional regulator